MEYNYATEFQQQLQKKYAKELCSDELTKVTSRLSLSMRKRLSFRALRYQVIRIIQEQSDLMPEH